MPSSNDGQQMARGGGPWSWEARGQQMPASRGNSAARVLASARQELDHRREASRGAVDQSTEGGPSHGLGSDGCVQRTARSTSSGARSLRTVVLLSLPFKSWSVILGHQSGRRPWSARTGRAWLLGVSEESAPRPLEAFPGVQRKYGSDLSSGQSRVSQHLTGVGHPGTDRGWRATDIGHASRKRSSRAPS